MSSGRSTHSLRKPGGWSLVSIGTSGRTLDIDPGTARSPWWPLGTASLISAIMRCLPPPDQGCKVPDPNDVRPGGRPDHPWRVGRGRVRLDGLVGLAPA